MDRIKTLIHIHTDYSYDSNISLEALARFAEDEGFGCLAVTDHDTIEGAKRLQAMTSVKVIIGEEITTRDGHLIGLFLNECVPPGMSAVKTAEAIRRQGGLVLLPHPFVKIFGCGLGDLSWQMPEMFDAVEVNNAQNVRLAPERKAHRFADQTNLISYAGADTHIASSIAPCYQIMRDFDGPADFLDSLSTAELKEGRHPISYFAALAVQVARSLVRMPQPAQIGANAPFDYLGVARPQSVTVS